MTTWKENCALAGDNKMTEAEEIEWADHQASVFIQEMEDRDLKLGESQ